MSRETQALYILETDRLRLRVPQLSDLPFEKESCMDERYRFMWDYQKPERCAKSLLMSIEFWTEHGYGSLTIEDKHTGVYQGKIYMHTRPIEPDNRTGWFMGFGVTAVAEGKGIAFEAAVAARTWYLDVCNVPRLYVDPSPENTRSRALAQRLGGVYEGTTAHEFYNTLELWRMRPS